MGILPCANTLQNCYAIPILPCANTLQNCYAIPVLPCANTLQNCYAMPILPCANTLQNCYAMPTFPCFVPTTRLRSAVRDRMPMTLRATWAVTQPTDRHSFVGQFEVKRGDEACFRQSRGRQVTSKFPSSAHCRSFTEQTQHPHETKLETWSTLADKTDLPLCCNTHECGKTDVNWPQVRSGPKAHQAYRGAGKSLARPGRKQAR